ncbi:MAG TPA: prepilin-type N-terminal cleavage/methylation domain-containing protein [Lacunisphaera sp.]|nr:prepilin-type N-terminal cleavage/methylation domain-containing protein [Lacunisphaera sp.]
MTTTIPSRTPVRDRRRGFTLVEIMIGAGLGAFLLAAVLSTFLFMGRSGANLRNYSDMEAQARTALELFAEDSRQASAITWNSSSSVTLTVIGVAVTYAYDSSAKTFSRTASGSTRTLITGITSGTFTFTAYNVNGTSLSLASASDCTASSASTKQIQISLQAQRTNTTVVAATNTVLSARFILRNKVVTA